MVWFYATVMWILLPPKSPVFIELLYMDTECRGWWMSPARCSKYLAMNARSNVMPSLLVLSTDRAEEATLMEFTSLLY